MLNVPKANKTSWRFLFGGQNKTYYSLFPHASRDELRGLRHISRGRSLAEITDNSCIRVKLLNSIKPKSLVRHGQDSVMQYFHLEQPLHELILCDRNDCEAIADYLEVADDGTEYRLCSFHTGSIKYASRLPARMPNLDLLHRGKPVD